MSILKFTSCRWFISFGFVLIATAMLMSFSAYAAEGFEEVERPAREKTIYFPQFHPVQSVNNEAYMVYQLEGKLALSDECLRVVVGDRGYLLVWPGWYTFDIVSRDIVISNLRTGAVVAQLKIGDTVSLGGGELEDRPFNLKYAIPETCKGPYWAVGDIQTIRNAIQPKPFTPHPYQGHDKPVVSPKKFSNPAPEKHDVSHQKPDNTAHAKPTSPHQKPDKPVQEVKKYVPKPKKYSEPTDSELEKSIDR
ncbi:hypothetical protein MCAMS1_00841 [biofilm metagenome]